MRHLESAVHAHAVAIGMQRDERLSNVPHRDRHPDDVHSDSLRVEDHSDTLRDVQIDLELGDAFPLGAGLGYESPELVGCLIALPVPRLNGYAPRAGGHVLRNRNAESARRIRPGGRSGRLQDHAAWRGGRGPWVVGVARVRADLPDRRSRWHEVAIGRGTDDGADLEPTEL